MQKRFMNELNALIKVNHPCVLHLVAWDYFSGPSECIFVTEFLPNDLDRVLRKAAARQCPSEFTPTKKSCIAFGIAFGMALLHTEHVTHRDLKPANIFLAAHFRSRIGDFGLAKMIGLESIIRETTTKDTPACIGGAKVERSQESRLRFQPDQLPSTAGVPQEARHRAQTRRVMGNAEPWGRSKDVVGGGARRNVVRKQTIERMKTWKTDRLKTEGLKGIAEVSEDALKGEIQHLWDDLDLTSLRPPKALIKWRTDVNFRMTTPSRVRFVWFIAVARNILIEIKHRETGTRPKWWEKTLHDGENPLTTSQL
jgi:serine/threonine protein kinase